MTTSSARLMLFSRAQEVLGIQEAEVLMDMLTPGEMFDAWRSDTQAGFSLVRSQLEISEAAVKKEIAESESGPLGAKVLIKLISLSVNVI